MNKCCGKIGPSVLDCDLACLSDEVQRVLDAGADYIHLDVMDGHFVPNISFGPYVIECLRKHHPNVPFDVHMMTTNPENFIHQVAKAASKSETSSNVSYTFHVETTEKRGITNDVIAQIKQHKMKVGIAISPATPIDWLFKYCDTPNQIDLVLIMTVVPGKGGQSFMHEMCDKIKILRQRYPDLDIQVDGGVKEETAKFAAQSGANLLVSGSGVFKAKDMAKAIRNMRECVDKEIEKD